jgi:hypothetical protein
VVEKSAVAADTDVVDGTAVEAVAAAAVAEVVVWQ